jgi:prepilin-type N-terminal cleavage/methylation domain-containing protein
MPAAVRALTLVASSTRRHGFTLVELLVAVAIVTVLLAAGAPAFTNGWARTSSPIRPSISPKP